MLCLICLDDFKEVLNVFTSTVLEYNIFEVVTKHFWLQPVQDDPLKNCICIPCWLKLETFHSFYLSVEEAHKSHSAKVVGLSVDKSLSVPSIKKEYIPRDDVDNFIDVANFLEQDLKLEKPEITVDPIKNQQLISSKNNVVEEKKTDSPKISKIIPQTVQAESSGMISRKRRSTVVKSTSNLEDEEDSDSSDSSTDDESDDSSSFSEKKSPKGKSVAKATNPKKIKLDEKSPRRKPGPKAKPKSESPKEYKPIAVQNRKLSKEFDEQIAKYMKLTCHLCSVNLPDFDELKNHFRFVHKKIGYAYCCEKQFHKRGLLVDHILVHVNPEHFKCKVCGKNLTGRRSLSVHMEVHKEKPKLIQCDKCPKTFINKMALKRHKPAHIPKEERSFSCTECGKLFACKYTLKQHYNTVHETTDATICDICGDHLNNQRALKLHLLAHEGIKFPAKKTPQVTCPKCGILLKNRYVLNRHMGVVHSEEDPQMCDNCGRTYPNPIALQRHLKEFHSDHKPQCNICNKWFRTPSDLAVHTETHGPAEEYNISCPNCDIKFNSMSHMIAHKKRIHEGYVASSKDVPQECQTCGTKLKNRYSLTRHMTAMHPETPNPKTCRLCLKIFPNPYALNNHMSLKHKNRRVKEEQDLIDNIDSDISNIPQPSYEEIMSISDSSHDVMQHSYITFH